MRIDPTAGPNPQSLPAGHSPAARTPRAADAGADEATCDYRRVPSGYGAYVRMAAGAEAIDTAAVTRARELLRSGQLDTPQAARRAAEALLSIGL
jgi:hypothetical protein